MLLLKASVTIVSRKLTKDGMLYMASIDSYRKQLLPFLTMALLFFSFDCTKSSFAAKKTKKSLEREEAVEDYYRAMFKYGKGDYGGSVALFEEIERIYPSFSKIASVKVMHAYLLYLKREYEKSMQECDAFVSLYPKSKYVPYLSYLKAMSQYRQITGLTKSYEIIIATRNEMQHVSTQYRDTIYGNIATDRLQYLEKVITNYSFSIGETYYNDRDYFAAINRYKKVLERESRQLKKSFSPMAYFRLFECYYILGMEDIAEFYKQKFVESMSNFNGGVSFIIEGVVDYVADDDTKAKGRKDKGVSTAKVNNKNLNDLYYTKKHIVKRRGKIKHNKTNPK